MSAITGVSSFNYYADYPGLYKNPSDAALAERTTTQVTGTDAGTENLKDAQSVTKIADGALGGVTDYLQQIREKAVKAMNTFTLNDDDRQIIQNEIEHLKQGIADLAGNTTFNEKQLLNGSNGDMTIAADGNGSTQRITDADATLEALGIKDFDVTKPFDLKTIDNAMEKVSSQRSAIGAQSNRLDHTIAYNQLSSYNHVASIKEDDISGVLKRVDEMRKNRVFETAQMMMLQKKQEQQKQQTMSLFI
ncbi:MAG: flagellin FliC5 [Lachnospiraceae bacterium]|nr:flagellin FliC5 [Lachnospiraceae bacterium]